MHFELVKSLENSTQKSKQLQEVKLISPPPSKWYNGNIIFQINVTIYFTRVAPLKFKTIPGICELNFYQDLNIPFVHNLAVETYNKFHFRLHPQPNPLVQNLSAPRLPDKPSRRLKRLCPRHLLQ